MSHTQTVAALFVDPSGIYSGLPGVELWDEVRDARTYDGPHPVVAHPPCARWSMMAPLVEALYGYRRGEDGGCFAAALAAVRRWGGVLEHPASSAAWAKFGLNRPPRSGGWARASICDIGWVCHVEQGQYGHRARKATWLYTCGTDLPSLRWGKSAATAWCVWADYDRPGARDVKRLERKERSATPPEFRDVLLAMARSAHTDTPTSEEKGS